jgi:hypothetical protein
MGLKQSIVIVNEYTVKSPTTNKASRGATPGDYVTRYMARELATETVAPIKQDRLDHFVLRYMARASATETAQSRPGLKQKMKRDQGSAGVSFGYGEVSLSQAKLNSASRDIQNWFDQGHTVMKTVLSFDEEYLRKHGLIPADFVCKKKGDYRGQLDQMKLRMAVMRGMERMGGTLYDDLRYVGVIQVDTEHVHAHLAIVDAGEGNLTPDGTQRGKILDRAKSLLRRGIDGYLDEKQSVKHMSSAVGYERRNVTTFVKRWAHQQMLRESLPQFLLSCLPEDRRLWRSSTNHASMKKANRIVHELVEDVLSRPGSPLPAAMAKVHAYAKQRRQAEGLTRGQWKHLVDNGRAQIIERGVNGVYGLLRALPENALEVRTPVLDAMSMDYEELAVRASQTSHLNESNDLASFGFRLRSYSARRDSHREKRKFYHQSARAWEQSEKAGIASEASRALYEFYLEEEAYHSRCAAKYQKFLTFADRDQANWNTKWQAVAEYGERMTSLTMLRKDASLRKMKDANEAETLGREIYGQSGGGLLTITGPAGTKVLDERLTKMRANYVEQVADLRSDLAASGLKLTIKRDPSGSTADEGIISPGAEYDFADVKGMDLHHMRYDFSTDVKVGKRARTQFVDWARSRMEHLAKAVRYLKLSRQHSAIESLPVADIESMVVLADNLEAQSAQGNAEIVLPSEVAALVKKNQTLRRSRTVTLDANLAKELESKVDEAAIEAAGIDPFILPEMSEKETEVSRISHGLE